MTIESVTINAPLPSVKAGLPPFVERPAFTLRPRKGSYRILSRADRYELANHFCALSMSDRIERFHGGMSDAAVAAYALGIDWDEHWIVALAPSSHIMAVAELVSHPIQGWDQCELVFSVPDRNLTLGQLSELTQLAVLEAAQRGCSNLETLRCH